MTRPSSLAVGAGALGGALLVAVFKGSILGMLFGAMLSPLPLAMAVFGLGPMFLPVAVVSGTVTVMVLSSSDMPILRAMAYLMVDAAPVAIMTRFLRLAREAPASGETIGKATTATVVCVVVVMTVGLLGMAREAGDGGIETLLRSSLDNALAAAPATAGSGIDMAALRAEIVPKIAGILPGAAAWNWSLRTLISAVLGQLMLKRMGLALIATPAYRRFTAPVWSLLLFGAAAGAAVLIKGDAGFIAGNAAVALCLVPVLQGLAVVHTLAGRLSYPRVALAVFYVSALRFPAVFLIVLVTVGMVEHFFALRSRFGQQPGGQ